MWNLCKCLGMITKLLALWPASLVRPSFSSLLAALVAFCVCVCVQCVQCVGPGRNFSWAQAI